MQQTAKKFTNIQMKKKYYIFSSKPAIYVCSNDLIEEFNFKTVFQKQEVKDLQYNKKRIEKVLNFF